MSNARTTKTNRIGSVDLLHTQEVIGSRPVGPINDLNGLAGVKARFFAKAHTNAHTQADWLT